MSFNVFIQNDEVPDLNLVIGLPQHLIDKVQAGDVDTCVNIAKAIISKYEKLPDAESPVRENAYLRTLDEHKFYMNFDHQDLAIREILLDFALHGEYEPHTTALVKDVVKPGDTAVDIGASIGYFTLLLARQVGKTGTVCSFEPTGNQYPILVKNIQENGYEAYVIPHNVAGWDRNEEVEIQTNKGNVGIMRGKILDELLPDRVDFIKIDTDGSEPHVLKGLLKTIENNSQLKMVIEFYPKYIKNLGGNPDDVMDILNKYFILEKIAGDYNDEYWNYYCIRK